MGNVIIDDSIEVAEMYACLEEYYEAAGFSGYSENVLSKMDNNEIKEHFKITFCGMSLESLGMGRLNEEMDDTED